MDDIVVEFASGQSQALLDRYVVNGEDLPLDTLRTVWRNTTKAVSWESPIHAHWLAEIPAVNRDPSRRHEDVRGRGPVAGRPAADLGVHAARRSRGRTRP